MEYTVASEIDKFLALVKKAWLNLMLSCMGELYKFSKYVSII